MGQRCLRNKGKSPATNAKRRKAAKRRANKAARRTKAVTDGRGYTKAYCKYDIRLNNPPIPTNTTKKHLPSERDE